MNTKRKTHRGQEGQSLVILAFATIGLLAIVGLAIDGAIIFWNQRRAQNGADAAVIAGTTALIDQTLSGTDIVCGSNEQPILDQIWLYASNNEVPEADVGNNVRAYYLVEDLSTGTRTHLLNGSGDPWEVGETGTVPCMSTGTKLAGLHVQTDFPQQTFVMGVVGLTESNVTTDAYAIWDFDHWCMDFAVYGVDTADNKDVVSVTGAGVSITNGGMHSNGGIHIGGGGQTISLEDDRPVEFSASGSSSYQIGCDKIIGGPDPDDSTEGDICKGIMPGVDVYTPPVDEVAYRYEDFAPGGYIWDEVASTERFHVNGDGVPAWDTDGDLDTNDITDTSGNLIDGLYVVEGDVKLNKLANSDIPWRTTIAARGQVQVSGGINQLPLARGVFVYSDSNNTSVGAIKLSGSYNSWAGLIMAPNGDFSTSAASNSDLAGMIIARRIDLSGSDIHINHRPEYCPVTPPKVLLVQ